MKKELVRGALRLFSLYCVIIVIFGVFLYPVISLAKDNLGRWLPVYSAFIFLLMFSMMYSEMWQLAAKEKKPQYGLHSFPAKGFILGLLASVPLILLALIYPLIHVEGTVAVNLKRYILHTILGPEFFIIDLLGKTVLAYAVALAVVPVITGLGYLAGFFDFRIRGRLKKASGQDTGNTPAFKKSPWNPTASQDIKDSKKKKKVTRK